MISFVSFQDEKNQIMKTNVWLQMVSEHLTSCEHVRVIYTHSHPTFIKQNWGLQGYSFISYCCFKTEIVNTRSNRLIDLDYQNLMSRVVRKPDFFICENKDADQLRGNREADQRLYFHYTDSTIPLLYKSEISSH